MTKVKTNSTVAWVDIESGEEYKLKIVPRSVEYQPVWTGERGRGKKFAYSEKIKLGDEDTIAPDSPIVKNSLGKTLGDIIEVNVDGTTYKYKIIDIDGETLLPSENIIKPDDGEPNLFGNIKSESEKLDVAKRYIESLISGTNPITGEILAAEDAVNEKNILESLKYILNILTSEHEKIVTEDNTKDNVRLSIIDNLRNFTYSEEGISTSKIVSGINRLIGRIDIVDYNKIINWLIKKEFLVVVKINGYSVKMPTPQGVSIGIYAEARKDYVATLYNKDAQRYIVDHITDILYD